MVKRTKKPAAKKQMKLFDRKFCVINHTTPYACGRTIKDTEQEAIEHAKKLIREDHNRNKSTTLYVVEIVKIVTTGEIPVTIHDPDDWIL